MCSSRSFCIFSDVRKKSFSHVRVMTLSAYQKTGNYFLSFSPHLGNLTVSLVTCTLKESKLNKKKYIIYNHLEKRRDLSSKTSCNNCIRIFFSNSISIRWATVLAQTRVQFIALSGTRTLLRYLARI